MFSEEKICLGICIDSICSGCFLRPYILLLGMMLSSLSNFAFTLFKLGPFLIHLYALWVWPQIHVQAVLCILLATFAGLGVAMSGSSIIVEFLRWRRRWRASQEQRSGSQSNHMSRPNHPESTDPDGIGPIDVRTHTRNV